MFFASSLPWRTACWAFGTQKPPTPPPVRSGTAQTSPAPQASAMISPSSVIDAKVRARRGGGRAPRSGRSVLRTTGLAMTPAVQTISVGLELLAGRQLDDAVDSGGELGVEVDLGAALGEVLDDPVAGLQRHLGHDAAHRLDEVEVRVVERQRRVDLSSALAKLRSSPKISMPAKPPPTTTKVSRRSRSGPAGRLDALSKLVRTRSRMATASSMFLRPMAWSATPGIGNVRETAPAVTTTMSYSSATARRRAARWSPSCSRGRSRSPWP